MKKVSKIMIVALSTLFILLVASPNSASAATLDSSRITMNDSNEIVIQLDSEQELLLFEQELARHNALAEQKWQEALKRSDVVSTVCDSVYTRGPVSQNSRMSTYSASKYYFNYYTIDFEFGFLITDSFSGYLTLVGSTYQNSYGTAFFDSIDSVTFRAVKTEDDVEDFNYRTTLLDASRTCAVNASCYVLVKYGSSGQKRYPVSFTREFYASANY